MKNLKLLVTTGVLAFLVTTANAATISVSVFDASTYNPSFASGNNVGEDFEDLGDTFGEGEVANGFQTAVGTFSAIGGVGSGGTVTGLPENTGTLLALRDGDVFGRVNTTPTGGNWFLDSNDTWGMDWTVGLSNATAFTSLMFTLTDGSDTGAFLRIIAGDDVYTQRVNGRLSNGNKSVVLIDFGGAVTSADIRIGNFSSNDSGAFFRNDGFSVDGIQVSAVPLPAGLLLLGSALAGLGILRRRRQAA